jgi:hypothetical protein
LPTAKLTQVAVERLRPPATGRIEYFDTQLPAFGLRISATGRKSWIVMYRVGGKLVRETLGTVSRIPKVDKAREVARDCPRPWEQPRRGGVLPLGRVQRDYGRILREFELAVPAPKQCPHCQCANLLPSRQRCQHVQEDIVLCPQTWVVCFDHQQAWCPQCRRDVIQAALAQTGHNLSQTAKLLGVSRPTLYDLLREHQLSADA